MARPKSAVRRVLTTRYVSWWAAKQAVRLVPCLSRPLHFYPKGIAAADAADITLEQRRWREPLPFSQDLARFVATDCRRYDTATAAYRSGDDAEFSRLAVIIRDAEVQGSTGSIVLPKAGATVTASGHSPNWNFARPKALRRGKPVQGLAIHSYKTASYFHFLLDNAWPTVDAIERYGIEAGTVIRHGNSAVQEAFYRGLSQRYPGVECRIVDDHETISVAEILRLAFGATNHEWSLIDRTGADSLAGIFRQTYGLPPPKRRERRIFLSRGRSKLRRLLNEAELVRIAADYGFEPFVASEGNHADQVRLFSEASHIVAVHGAGLANLVFVPPGACLLELFPSNFTKSTFAWLATRLGIGYRWLIGTTGDYSQSFQIDTMSFRETIEEIFGNTQDNESKSFA